MIMSNLWLLITIYHMINGKYRIFFNKYVINNMCVIL